MTDVGHGRPAEVFDRAASPQVAETEAEGQPGGAGTGPTHQRSPGVTSRWPKFDRALWRPLVVGAVGTFVVSGLLLQRINPTYDSDTQAWSLIFLLAQLWIFAGAVGLAAGAMCAPGERIVGGIGTLIGWGLGTIALWLVWTQYRDVLAWGGAPLMLSTMLPVLVVYLLVAAFVGRPAKA
jgi:lipopolysaccharide export LptBFGC system permease protein LptF